MSKEKYLQQRNALLAQGQELINSGKFKEFNEIKKQIEDLDNNFEEVAVAQANLHALENNAKVTDFMNKGVNIGGGTIIDSTDNSINDDMYASLEYRQAFMNHVIKGQAIPSEFLNAVGPTKTTDIGALVPSTVLEKIIEKIEATGMILQLVTKTNLKGGVTVPISQVKPVATWVAEGATSEKQKKTLGGNITFAYHKLRCAVSTTLETDVISLAIFESKLINNVSEAMVKALEEAIIKGTGSGQPKGILKESPEIGQEITVSTLDYDTLTEAEGALPLEYEEGAVWCMTKKTFMKFVSMKDVDGQPIGRVNYGIGGKPERILLGRSVILCNYLDTYTPTLETSKVFAFLFNFSDYALNTNYNMGLKQYEDNETDDIVTKAIMLTDGKVLDKGSLVTLKRQA